MRVETPPVTLVSSVTRGCPGTDVLARALLVSSLTVTAEGCRLSLLSWGWTVLGQRHVETVTMETCNVLVLGDQGAGKSCLINRFLTGQFIHNQVC